MTKEQFKKLRECFSADDGSGKPLAHNVTYIFDNDIAFYNLLNFVIHDDENEMIYQLSTNKDTLAANTSAPYRIGCQLYSNLQCVEGVFNKDNFKIAIQKLFVDSGLINDKQKAQIETWMKTISYGMPPINNTPYFVEDTTDNLQSSFAINERNDVIVRAGSMAQISAKKSLQEIVDSAMTIAASTDDYNMHKVRNEFVVEVDDSAHCVSLLKKVADNIFAKENILKVSISDTASSAVIYSLDKNKSYSISMSYPEEIFKIMGRISKPVKIYVHDTDQAAYNTTIVFKLVERSTNHYMDSSYRHFKSMTKLIDGVKNPVIYLESENNNEADIKIGSEKTVELYLCNKTLNIENLKIEEGASLVICDSGNLNVKNPIQVEGSLIVNGGIYRDTSFNVGGTMMINGGKFYCNDCIISTNSLKKRKSMVTVYGGMFIIEDPNVTTIFDGDISVIGGIFDIDVGEFCPKTYTCIEKSIANKQKYAIVRDFEAKIGNNFFATLQEAIDSELSVENPIQLNKDLKDVGEIKIARRMFIDGMNHTISGNSYFTITQDVAELDHVYIINTKFDSIHNNKSQLSPIYAKNIKSLVYIKNCEFTNIDWDCIQIIPADKANDTFIGIEDCKFDSVDSQRYIHIEANLPGANFATKISANYFHGIPKNAIMDVDYFTDERSINITNNIYTEEITSTSICVLNSKKENMFELAVPFDIRKYDPNDKLYIPQRVIDPVAVVKTGFETIMYNSLERAIKAAHEIENAIVTGIREKYLTSGIFGFDVSSWCAEGYICTKSIEGNGEIYTVVKE